MKRPNLTREEAQMLAQIRLQRAQVQQERSRALPTQLYRDPSENVRFERETMKAKKRGEP